VLVDNEEVEKIRKHLDKRFGKVLFEKGKELSYLGMQIRIKESGIIFDMTYYMKKILEDEDVQVMRSPATKNMFIVDRNSQLLGEEDRKQFHTKTAKLLYLAKRARPDILTAVSFLCTRAQSATEEDAMKLARVLGYV
jgi:hypothetical protein